MNKIQLRCGACGCINERKSKQEPENAKEKKQIYFICSNCQAKNLRDGTYVGQTFPEKDSQEIEECFGDCENCEYPCDDVQEFSENEKDVDIEKNNKPKSEEQKEKDNKDVGFWVTLLGLIGVILIVSNSSKEAKGEESKNDFLNICVPAGR